MEMTAIYCANCPPASAEAKRLINNYKGNVIGINIHASQLANPASADDPRFRNEDSDALHEFAGFPPLPVGFINYYADPINNNSAFSGWEGEILAELEKEPNMMIDLEVSESEGNYTISYDVNYIQDQSETEKLVIYIVENGIVGTQKNGTVTIPDYVHNYVSRGSITGISGLALFNETALTGGETASGSVEFTIDDGWVKENINLVAFIFDENTNYVYQAEEISLVN